MDKQFKFNELNSKELHEALTLVRDVFLEYEAPDYSEEGIEEFMRFIKPAAIKKMLSENTMNIWTCQDSGRIVGVLAGGKKGNKHHIFLLFVNGQYQRKGIARRLFTMMKEHYNPTEITVNSSPYAVEAYHRLGFSDTDAEQTVNGIRFTPMRCTL